MLYILKMLKILFTARGIMLSIIAFDKFL